VGVNLHGAIADLVAAGEVGAAAATLVLKSAGWCRSPECWRPSPEKKKKKTTQNLATYVLLRCQMMKVHTFI
jgi:hypothetical protein